MTANKPKREQPVDARAEFEAWAASIGFCVTGKYAETVDVLCAKSAFKAGHQAGRAAANRENIDTAPERERFRGDAIRVIQDVWDRAIEIDDAADDVIDLLYEAYEIGRQKPAPGVSALVEALDLMVTTHDEGGWPTATMAIARAALAAYRQGGGE